MLDVKAFANRRITSRAVAEQWGAKPTSEDVNLWDAELKMEKNDEWRALVPDVVARDKRFHEQWIRPLIEQRRARVTSARS
jgi:hypothetical protein